MAEYVNLILRQKDFTFKEELIECRRIGKSFPSKNKKIKRLYQKIQYKHPFYNKTVEGIVPESIIY